VTILLLASFTEMRVGAVPEDGLTPVLPCPAAVLAFLSSSDDLDRPYETQLTDPAATGTPPGAGCHVRDPATPLNGPEETIGIRSHGTSPAPL